MRSDEVFYLDMLIAARKIKEFTGGMSRDDFDQSELHQNAVVRLIQVIGEAARQVSDAAKAAHPEISWQNIIGMRNTLVHRYFKIELDYVWNVATIHLNELIAQLEPLIPPEENAE